MESINSTDAPPNPAKRLKRRGKRLLWVSALLMTLAGGGAWAYFSLLRPASSGQLALPVFTTEPTTLEQLVNESGTVSLGNQQEIKSPGEVTVDRVLVQVGDSVTPGQELLRLRSRDQSASSIAEQDSQIREQSLKLEGSRNKLQELEAQLLKAQAELAPPPEKQLEITKLQAELSRSRQKIGEAETKLAVERQKLKDTQTLAQKGFIATDELRGQEESTRGAEVAVKDAEFEFQTRSLDLQKAQLDTERIKQVEDKIQQFKSQIRESKLDLLSNEQALKKLQIARQERLEQLQKNIIKAPINGVILAVSVNDGDGVNYDKVLLSLGNPSIEQVKLQLGTLDAIQVKPGQVARVRMIGPSQENFLGVVKTLDPQAIAQDGGGSFGRGSTNQSRVPALIELDRPSGQLIPGSQVTVAIVVQQKQDAIALNIEAIQRTEPEPFVWLLDQQSQAQKRTVQLGLETDTQVEIVKGLKEGDRILLATPEIPLVAGMTIQPLPPPSADQSLPPDLASPTF